MKNEIKIYQAQHIRGHENEYYIYRDNSGCDEYLASDGKWETTATYYTSLVQASYAIANIPEISTYRVYAKFTVDCYIDIKSYSHEQAQEEAKKCKYGSFIDTKFSKPNIVNVVVLPGVK